MDATNYIELKALCQIHKFDGIIHFAGYKAVGESVAKPLMYYYNNLLTTMNLASVALEEKIIFSFSNCLWCQRPHLVKMQNLERIMVKL